MYVWTVETQQSFVTMSDHTDHKAPAVMISIKPILEKLIKQEKKLINIIIDNIWDIIAFNLDIPHYSVKDLLERGLQEKLPSKGIITYSKDAVISLAENIPETTGIVGTMKIHDICCYPQSNNTSVWNLSQEKAREVELSY